jgi:hypothetical protein
MVQRCINEDFLRYQRTLLVLTECIDKTKLIGPQLHIPNIDYPQINNTNYTHSLSGGSNSISEDD